MPVMRRILPRATVPGVAALLLGVTAMAAHASAAPTEAAPGVVIAVAAAGSHGAVSARAGAYRVGSAYAAQSLAAELSVHANVTVELPTGTLDLPRPLVFSAADSGRDGHTITWEAAPGAHPVLSGARPVNGWRLYNASSNIWVANVRPGTNTRQLYVNGAEAPNASIQVPRSGLSFPR